MRLLARNRPPTSPSVQKARISLAFFRGIRRGCARQSIFVDIFPTVFGAQNVDVQLLCDRIGHLFCIAEEVANSVTWKYDVFVYIRPPKSQLGLVQIDG